MSEAISTSGEQLDYALLEGVLRVYGSLQQTIAGLMGELELTEPLADTLWQLGPERPLSRRELAERLRCDPSNVTFLVDRLEEKGLVERAVDPHDRRIKAVSLTAAGALARQRLVAGAAAAPILTGLATAKKQQLTRLLQECLESAAAHAAHSGHVDPAAGGPPCPVTDARGTEPPERRQRRILP